MLMDFFLEIITINLMAYLVRGKAVARKGLKVKKL